MKFFILNLCLLFTYGAFCQGSQLVGKWKVVKMYDERMYFDFEKDSLKIFKEDKDLSKQEQDSVAGKVKMIFNDIFRDAYYQFNADSTYRENSGMNGERGGTYTVDESTQTITLKRVRKSKVTGEESIKEEKIFFIVEGNSMRFVPPAEESGPTIEFKKQ